MLASPAAAEAAACLWRAWATAAALGRTDVTTFSPDSPRLDTCIAKCPLGDGVAPSRAASFSRSWSIGLPLAADAAGAALADFAPAGACSSALRSGSSFFVDGCDAALRHSALLAAAGRRSMGVAPTAVASGAPVSLRLTFIRKPGEVGPSWATTTADPGSAAAGSAAARHRAAMGTSRNRDGMRAPHGRCALHRSAGSAAT